MFTRFMQINQINHSYPLSSRYVSASDFSHNTSLPGKKNFQPSLPVQTTWHLEKDYQYQHPQKEFQGRPKIIMIVVVIIWFPYLYAQNEEDSENFSINTHAQTEVEDGGFWSRSELDGVEHIWLEVFDGSQSTRTSVWLQKIMFRGLNDD